MLTVLHLDDDALFLHRCHLSFRTSSHVAHIRYDSANSTNEFKEKMRILKPDALLLDLSFGGAALRGLDVLREVRSEGYAGMVIVMSALSTSEVILNCLRSGANDFLSKGLDESELTFRIARLLQASQNSLHEHHCRPALPAHVAGHAMREILQRLERVIRSSIRSLLVTGESGTGKEMVAETLRTLLPVGTPFVSLNCGALAKDLTESEIFGHEKGSFTGATQNKIGLYEAADGGWIFFDEVARLSHSAQAALLRAMENGEVRPIGSARTRKVNVRVIAATNEPLEALVERGEFRGDLLSRLRGYELILPPIRARSRAERHEIIETLLHRLNSTLPLDTQEFRLTASCMSVLCDLPWAQGNIRELWQTLQSMSVDATDGVLSLESLPKRFLNQNISQDKLPTPQTSLERNIPQLGVTELPDSLKELTDPTFPLNFANLVDEIFEQLLKQLKSKMGDVNLSQRVVAQMFTMSRHEATQRLSRSGNTIQ